MVNKYTGAEKENQKIVDRRQNKTSGTIEKSEKYFVS